jgi:methionyl aminopeptidase
MIELKSKREIEVMQEAARIIQKIFAEVQPAVCENTTTNDLDAIAEKVIRANGGKSAFKGYRGFPKVACISVNEEVVHGIPGSKKLKKGDLVSFDIGVIYKNFYSDAARSWCVGGNADAKTLALMDASKGGMEAALQAYQPGCHIGDLSAAIQEYIESRGFGVVRDFVGHGIGKNLHEEPQVPNYGKAGRGLKIEPGLVLAIEPMVTEGAYEVQVLADGWTVVTRDRSRASHYEDTIAFLEDGFINLTGGYAKKFA